MINHFEMNLQNNEHSPELTSLSNFLTCIKKKQVLSIFLEKKYKLAIAINVAT